MLLFDVNVLLYAHREDTERHAACLEEVEKAVNGPQAFGFYDLVASSFLRIVTHSRIFNPPSPPPTAWQFIEGIRSSPNCVLLEPGSRHWQLFKGLCETAGAKGSLIPDAYLAALAIESGCTWVSTDRDYGRFVGLDWRLPGDERSNPPALRGEP
jgi:toxin-antitoxin system PIN domain toxin